MEEVRSSILLSSTSRNPSVEATNLGAGVSPFSAQSSSGVDTGGDVGSDSATFVGALLADFAAYLESGAPTLTKDRVGYRQVPLWLTDDEFDALAERMATAVQEHADNPPAPGRRRRLLTTIVMPDKRT